MFRFNPPSILPMFAVVSESMRPKGKRVKASDVTSSADTPFSGSSPAWAARPVISAATTFWEGADTVIRLGEPSPSRTMPVLAVSKLKSMWRAPTNPPSSCRLKATSTARWGPDDSAVQASASNTMASPALQSPPRIVVPSLRSVSPCNIGLMPRPGSTVSRWAESSSGSPTPSSRAMMLW